MGTAAVAAVLVLRAPRPASLWPRRAEGAVKWAEGELKKVYEA